MENIVQEKQKLNVGYFFLSLGVLVSLIVSVVAFLNLAFEILDKRFPDVLNATYQYGYMSSQYDGARTFVAMLIIMFPAFLVLAYFWKKKEKNILSEKDHVIRKWLSYVIIFLSILIVAIDLIVLVRYFVSGEITIRFILKVFIALASAKTVLYYFIPEVWEIKWKNLFKNLAIYFSIAMVFALIVWSFFVMGSPFKQRQLALDDRRVSDLQNIQSQLINYWQQKEKLPKDLSTLSNPMSGFSIPVDPEFQKGKKYEYNIKDEKTLTFELCADFSLPMPQGWQEYQKYGTGIAIPVASEVNVATGNVRDLYSTPSGANESWYHQIGRTCFERTIDKDIYPPYSKVSNN